MRRAPRGKGPRVSRPFMPGYDMMFRKGRKLLSWPWAAEHLSRAHNYYLTTIWPNGRPHVMPVWGVWLGKAFYFSTGRRSRKSKNLERNPNCIVCPEGAAKAVIMEGTARQATERILLKRVADIYKQKYGSDILELKEPIYEVHPRVTFGIVEDGSANPTRWAFSEKERSATLG